MASEKNITMRQYNGVDYDTLYPKTKVEQVEGAYTQQQILADSTKGLYGLDSGAVPDDVFSLLKTLVTNAQSSADEKAKIETGYYTGTGVYGESNPNVLNFDFPPTYIIIFASVIRNGCVYMNELTTEYVDYRGPSGSSDYSCYGKKSSDGKTIYWYTIYTNGGASAQLNASGVKYYYMAIQ